jgi:predicted nucleic acid-binding protein
MIDRSQEHRHEVAELYEDRRIPLATLARTAGNNLFETWASIVQNTGTRLYATNGNLAEMERAAKALSAAEDVVVEMSGLLTLCYLDLLDKLPQAFGRVIVARQTFDKLEAWLAELERQSPYMTMWKERDQYFRTEITKETIGRRREFLGQIRSFLVSHADVVPAVKALDVPDEQMQEYEELLGESACGSLFVASELKLPLHVDDMGLSLIASDQRWQVQGVSTPLLLMRMKSRGLISAAGYYAALKRLLLGNYSFMPVTSEALWWMCVDEGRKATTAMRRILLATIGPDCVEELALVVGVDLIRRVWLEVRDPEEKIKLVDLVIYALSAGRDTTRITSRLKEMLPGAFRYLPRALPRVFERIDAFDQAPVLEHPDSSQPSAREEPGGES